MNDDSGSGTWLGSANEMINKIAMISAFKEQHINTTGHIQPQRQNPGQVSNPDLGNRKGSRLEEGRLS